MKLIMCYIENFGKLQQFTYQFQDGLNTIHELNGWGKSTFAAFIRSMFYGMDGSRKKNIDEVERKKYMPWQGGRFGGYIIFESAGKEYKIERFFFDKIKDDTFTLYNQKTGLESKDFSENIGEELFKLDRTAYSRSTYIPQNSISITANDSINAKLSNLIENDQTNDINNYDLSMKILEKAKKEYVKTGSRGKLDLIKDTITTLEQKLEISLSQGKSIEKWNEKLDELIVAKNQIKEKSENVKSKVETASKYETWMTKLHQYDELCANETEILEALAPLRAFFHSSIPTDENLTNCDEISSDLLKVEGELKSYDLSSYEKSEKERLQAYFKNGIPEELELTDCEKLIFKYRENKVKIETYQLTELEQHKLSELDQFFANGLPEELEIDQFVDKISTLNLVTGNLSTEISKSEILKTIPLQTTPLKKNNAKPNGILLMAGIIIILIGILISFFLLPLGIGCIIIGIFLCFAAKINSSQMAKRNFNVDRSNEKITDLTLQKEMIEEEFDHFIERFGLETNQNNYYSALNIIKTKRVEYMTLSEKMDSKDISFIKNEQEWLIKSIDSYLSPYLADHTLSIEEKDAICKTIRKDRERYLSINSKLLKFSEIKTIFNESKHLLYEFLNIYFDEIDDNPIRNINIIKDRCKEYDRLKKALIDCQEKKARFGKENDIEQLKMSEAPQYTLEKLHEIVKTYDEELDAIKEEENNARAQIRELSESADQYTDLLNEISLLRNELNEGMARLNILNKTIQCMEDAKCNFSTRYMDRMNNGFERYMKMLDNGSLEETHMDVQLGVHILAYGTQRNMEYYSTGYKDLIGIATRFALVEALFENEKPFIILDDPFSNLDADKLNNALDMIKKTSKNYQIIYFVCHESRTTAN